ncbi:MAG: hypothetical protein Q9M11_03655, partial [Mariprofundaceae bacterium]|nr:hypothetical protein [Mariprofundaceae bacterium]
MNINKRTAVMTLPTGQAATLAIEVTCYKKLMFMDTNYLTPRIIVESSNLELAVGTASKVVVTDPAMVGRYLLLSTNMAPHNNLEYAVYYDNKYGDILVIPTLETYASMPYINSSNLTIAAYAGNFSGTSGDRLPTPNTGYNVKSTLAEVAKYTNNQSKGVYYQKLVTPTLNYSSTSIYGTLLVNFGTPALMFPTLGFVTDINVFGYDSLFESNPQHLGKQPIVNTGTLVLELPL